MEKKQLLPVGTLVTVDLDIDQSQKLGIHGIIKGEAKIMGHYTNGVPGYYVQMTTGDPKQYAIADKYSAVKEKIAV